MDNFRGQIVPSVTDLLEANNIHTCLLPPNTTDKLQPMDLSVNKPAKDFLKRKFEDWYAQKQMEQMSDETDILLTDLQPVNLGLPVLKELGAQWMVEMADYFTENPQIIVNGFVRAGITAALDGKDPEDDKERDYDYDTESDFDATESDLESDSDYCTILMLQSLLITVNSLFTFSIAF